MRKQGQGLDALKEALERRGEIEEIGLTETGNLFIKFKGYNEWASMYQDTFRQWNVSYCFGKKPK